MAEDGRSLRLPWASACHCGCHLEANLAELGAVTARFPHRSGCDVQYLGVAGDYFSTHAYHVTPNAAAVLLRHTKPRCNDRKQDYALRSLCTAPPMPPGTAGTTTAARGPGTAGTTTAARGAPRLRERLRCTKPITMLTPVGRGFVSGWGLFVQDHRSFAPYTKLSLGRKNAGVDYLSRAQSHSRCAPRQQGANNGTSAAGTRQVTGRHEMATSATDR